MPVVFYHSAGLSLIFPVGGEMKKVAGEQDFLELGLWERGGGGWGVGGHVWKFQDKVTTKIFPNVTNLFYAIFKPL